MRFFVILVVGRVGVVELGRSIVLGAGDWVVSIFRI